MADIIIACCIRTFKVIAKTESYRHPLHNCFLYQHHPRHVFEFFCFEARPDIHTVVTEDTDNATHYQSVTCSATNGKPMALIRWEINGSPPTDNSSVEMRNTSYTNGTATMTSILRFPTHLQDQDRVTCVVQHPTLPDPTTHVTVGVETFSKPASSCTQGLHPK